MEMSRVQKEVQGIGLKACASCKQEKPMVEFSPQGGKRSRKHKCRACYNKTDKMRDRILEQENKMLKARGLKKCNRCKIVKSSSDDYYKLSRGDIKSSCKDCQPFERNPNYKPPTVEDKRIKEEKRVLKEEIKAKRAEQLRQGREERLEKEQQREVRRIAISSFIEWRRNGASKEWLEGWNKGLGQRYWDKTKKNNPEMVRGWAKAKCRRYGKRIRIGKDKTFTGKVAMQLLKDIKHCPYCGIDLVRENTHLDHMKPVSKGGLHSKHNIIPCCSKCNIKKRDKPFYEWVSLLNEPYKAQSTIHYGQRYVG